MDIHVLTVFPQLYRPFRRYGLLKKALNSDKVSLSCWSLRRFTRDDYGNIDGRAYGGEHGMVLKPEPFFRGVEHIRETRGEAKTILMAPDGRVFDNDSAKDLSKRERMIILSGRYEGIDHRVREHLVDEVWSVGPYVTPGGDIPSLALISSVIRHIPGVVGNETSVEEDSFQDNRLAPPHYTRPRTYREHSVPETLLSGDHDRIEEWRERKALERTRRNRPELLDEDDSEQNDTENKNEQID
jgi:tRNA (guanine37-N1)-methyltransferase